MSSSSLIARVYFLKELMVVCAAKSKLRVSEIAGKDIGFDHDPILFLAAKVTGWGFRKGQGARRVQCRQFCTMLTASPNSMSARLERNRPEVAPTL
jgi:hypothetical protein